MDVRAPQFAAGNRKQPRWADQPDGERGRDATTSLVPVTTAAEKWKFIHDGLSRFAGRKLPLNEEVYASASETNFRNRSIARMLQSLNRIYSDPVEGDGPVHEAMLAECQRKDVGLGSWLSTQPLTFASHCFPA